MKPQKSLILTFAVVLVSCGSKDLEFSNYEKNVEAQGPDGSIASLELTLPTPQGEGELQANVTNAVKEIITHSRIAEEIGSPEGERLQDIADSYYERFKVGVNQGELETLCVYHLQITCPYRNSQFAVFHVSDGVYGNGGPSEYVWNVRLSDGHLMTFNEISTMSGNNLKQLAYQFVNEDTKQAISEGFEHFWLSPDPAGCKVKVQTGTHFFHDFIIPLENIEPYLTTEGKMLFEIESETAVSDIKSQGTSAFTDTRYPIQHILDAYEAALEKQLSPKQIAEELAPIVEEAKEGEILVGGKPFGISCSKAVVYDYNVQSYGINIILKFIPEEGTDFHLANKVGPYGKKVYCMIYGKDEMVMRQTVTWATKDMLGVTLNIDLDRTKKWKKFNSIELTEIKHEFR